MFRHDILIHGGEPRRPVSPRRLKRRRVPQAAPATATWQWQWREENLGCWLEVPLQERRGDRYELLLYTNEMDARPMPSRLDCDQQTNIIDGYGYDSHSSLLPSRLHLHHFSQHTYLCIGVRTHTTTTLPCALLLLLLFPREMSGHQPSSQLALRGRHRETADLLRCRCGIRAPRQLSR